MTSEAGIQPRTDGVAILELAADLHDLTPSPAAAVAAVAEQAAQRQGWRLSEAGLRLADHLVGFDAGVPVDFDVAPGDLGRLYELLLSPVRRRRGGVHLTPGDVAAGLVNLLEPQWRSDGRVLDPSVGGGAFLLAAFDELQRHGVAPATAWSRLAGIDIDPVAVAVAECALALRLVHSGGQPAPHPGLVTGDGLIDPLPASAVVVGNPPFLNQLRRSSSNAGDRRAALRARFGDLVGAYTDEAWLFIVAALDALEPDGQLALVQPLSVLAARDANGIRAHADQHAAFAALWLSNGRVFDAAIEVCGLHLIRRNVPERGAVRRLAGRTFDEIEPAERPKPAEWGVVGSAIAGIPTVDLWFCRDPRESSLRDLAKATAGFRDQFYGFAPHVVEASSGAPDAARPKLVTVGMIEPASLRWGTTSFRFAGSRWHSPVLDLDKLRAEDGDLARWVDARLTPKVVVATQTRVIEPWVDEAGLVVPATPVISIEPQRPDDVWLIGSLLLAPHLTALIAAARFGSALSLRALKFSAADLLALPLPRQRDTWAHAASLLKEACEVGGAPTPTQLVAIATAMCEAFEDPDPELIAWWTERLAVDLTAADIPD